MRQFALMILGLVLAVAAASAQNAAKDYKSPTAVGPWSFDKYLSHDEVTERLQLLAKQNPQRVRLISMGKSIGGRDLWVCEITDDIKRAKQHPRGQRHLLSVRRKRKNNEKCTEKRNHF